MDLIVEKFSFDSEIDMKSYSVFDENNTKVNLKIKDMIKNA